MSPTVSADQTAPARNGNNQAAPPVPRIPFSAAAHFHTEQFDQRNAAFGADVGPIDVAAFGYIRNIYIEVVATGGSGGTLAADAPWNFFKTLQLTDVNGAPIFGPLTGYYTYLANKYGGYAFRQDPADSPFNTGTVNFAFMLRIPVEITQHNGFGALANQNAAAAYKLSYSTNAVGTVFSAAPTTNPTVNVRCFLEAWTLPDDVDILGRPQEQIPPAHGTTQYWSYFNKAINNGQNTILLPRVGNLIRELVFVARDGTGARSDAAFPNPVTLSWDARQLYGNETQNFRNQLATESQTNNTRPTGVFVYPFNNSIMDHSGDENPNLWLPTVQATRLEISGVTSSAGTVDVITNDIAPVEVSPAERFVETSATGFHPAVGVGAGAGSR